MKDNATFAGISVKDVDKELIRKIDDNRKEYERLMKDADYTNVRFNPENGALSAIHKKHTFDPTIGIFGIPRGDYERISLDVLYEYGNKVILGSETPIYKVKVAEGILNEIKFDIKGIEGTGKENILKDIKDASKKGAETVVLYYHKNNLFNESQMRENYNTYLRTSKSKRVQKVYYIVDRILHTL